MLFDAINVLFVAHRPSHVLLAHGLGKFLVTAQATAISGLPVTSAKADNPPGVFSRSPPDLRPVWRLSSYNF